MTIRDSYLVAVYSRRAAADESLTAGASLGDAYARVDREILD